MSRHPFLYQGERDVVTLTTLAEEYFEEVEAPTKGLALIPDAGHFAAFTQPQRFLTELGTRVRPLTSPPTPHPSGEADAASQEQRWQHGGPES